MITPFFKSTDRGFTLLHGDCTELLNQFDFKFDMIFADPPYFLSNGGISVQSGKMVSVNKGDWDKSQGFEKDNEFNYQWLKACREKLKDNGTIWISGTYHNIFSVAQMLTELNYKILNCVTWAKTNPPPNLCCRYFTHSTEFILWARKHKSSKHFYNYELMKQINGGKQMRDVWNMPAIGRWEKSCGKHPTQKPLAVLSRIILASTQPNAWILDPFTGSSTTGIAANLLGRRFLGIDKELNFLEISKNRKLEIENSKTAQLYKNRMAGFIDKNQLSIFLNNENPNNEIKVALGFCRKKDISKLQSSTMFYFHAIESEHKIKDFPTGILDAKRLVIYSGGRSNPFILSGLYADIETIELKHKSQIKGKEKSEIEYYYEIVLASPFIESENLKHTINTKKIFGKEDKQNENLFKQFLPSITTWDKILKC